MGRGGLGFMRRRSHCAIVQPHLIKAWEGAVLRAKVEKNGTPSKNSKQRVREIAYLAPQPSEK